MDYINIYEQTNKDDLINSRTTTQARLMHATVAEMSSQGVSPC